MFEWPEKSPWGDVQRCKSLCAGVFQVSTASHGGVMARHDIAKAIFSPAARKTAFKEGGYTCFEEDCAGAVAIRELLDKKLYKAPVNEYFQPGEFERLIDSSIQSYHPEYWQAREKAIAKAAPEVPGQQRMGGLEL